MANVIIVLLIVTYCAWVIYTHFFRKKDGHKCSGICAGCATQNELNVHLL